MKGAPLYLAPVIRPVDAKNYELAEEFEGVPRGFVTDGASLPRFLWRVLGHPLDPLTIGPAIVHDWHYQTGCVSRRRADLWLVYNLERNGVSILRALLFYAGVRAFGWLFYRGKVNKVQKKGNKR